MHADGERRGAGSEGGIGKVPARRVGRYLQFDAGPRQFAVGMLRGIRRRHAPEISRENGDSADDGDGLIVFASDVGHHQRTTIWTVRHDMCIGMRVDTCVDMFIVDMCIDMCIGMCVNVCIDTCIDMCIDMCIDTCIDTCIDMCIDMCIDICIEIRIDI